MASTDTIVQKRQFGHLAQKWANIQLELQIMQSAAGYYIGTQTPEGMPCSRESENYYPTREAADTALADDSWIQRKEP